MTMATAAVVHQPDQPQSEKRAPAPLVPKGAYQTVMWAAARIEPLLPKGVTLQQVAASVYLATKKDPMLTECTPESLIQGVSRIAQWGLEVGVTAHLVAFNTKVKVPQEDGTVAEQWHKIATPIADYKGLAQLMYASGIVRGINVQAVFEGDDFSYELGMEPRLEHRPGKRKPAAKVLAAYCILTLRFGHKELLVMEASEIDAIRQGYSKQWKQGPLPPWYAKKTVLRQAAKLVPNPRLTKALQVIDEDAQLDMADAIDAEVLAGSPARALLAGAATDDAPVSTADDDTPVHGRPGQQFDTDPLREEGEPNTREYQLREQTPGPDLYGDAPVAVEEDLEARRTGLRRQIADLIADLPKPARETIADQVAKERDLGGLQRILAAQSDKRARRDAQGA